MQPLVAMQIFTEGQRNDREGVLVVGTDADPLGGLEGQRPDIDIRMERIAPHQLDRDGAELRHGCRDVNAQDAAILLPALVVLVRAQDEHLVLGRHPVGADAFEYAGAVVQRMGRGC